MEQNTNESYLHQKSKHRVKAILNDREQRSMYTLSLIDKYQKPVFVGRVNYPGLYKNNSKVDTSFAILREVLTNHFQGAYDLIKYWHGADGPALILVLKRNERGWKRECMAIEESHPQGRIWDLDVYSTDYEPLTRTDFGAEHRACLICSESAKVCSAQRKHSLEEIIEKVDCIIEGRNL